MTSAGRKELDILVVGGGPAGLSAALCAAECGLQVAIADDNPEMGGQIWRAEMTKAVPEAAGLLGSLRNAGVQLLSSTRVVDEVAPQVLLAEGAEGAIQLGFRKLILATGARERFLPFPGWTLPHVVGAGGLQALVKSGLPVAGRRIIVAGTGPLLLAAAAYLRAHGAEIRMVCEQASRASLARLCGALIAQPKKLIQALSLRNSLGGIPLATTCWIVAARGSDVLEEVVISREGKMESIPCDYLACGFHLVPNTELAALVGCRRANGYVEVDEFQRTSQTGVFCAGEPTGIGGLELSMVEGKIAGLAAAGREDAARKLFGRRRRLEGFARALDRAFVLRPQLKELVPAETIVCRCEDVRYAQLAKHASWRTAKLMTRLGMGPCQGRICGPAAEFLLGWAPDSVRPPVFPVTVENLASSLCGSKPDQSQGV
jgi:NADPH-dependent 2,4-dienoyl-CoA reductase/sulfur reductase-like enzyme